MNAILTAAILLVGATPPWTRHTIAAFPAGYQVAASDLNADGRLDVVALATETGRVDWYENPTWRQRPVARIDQPIDLAVHDLDGDGKPEIALAYGFYFGDSARGGQIAWLQRRDSLDEPWSIHPIATDPVVHRLRWADLDADGRKKLIHAPIFGPGSNSNLVPRPSHLWAFQPPSDLATGSWTTWRIDESLTVLHGLFTTDLEGNGRQQILTASYEGLCRFDYRGSGSKRHWQKTVIAPGAPPQDNKPGALRGSSEVAPGQLGPKRTFLAAIEPWHGHQVVVYTPGSPLEPWKRQVLDSSLAEGHALVVADWDADGQDEIIAGWRAQGGGLTLYDFAPEDGRFHAVPLDRGIPVEARSPST